MTGTLLMPRKRQNAIQPTQEELERGVKFADWLRAGIARSGQNGKTVAEKAGLSSTYIYDLLNDGIKLVNGVRYFKRPSEEAVREIAIATLSDVNEGLRIAGYQADDAAPSVPRELSDLSVDLQYKLASIITQLREPALPTNAVELTPNDLTLLPVVGNVGAAGTDTQVFAEEHARERVPVPRALLRNNVPQECFAVRVRGTSMVGAHILPGDLLICRNASDGNDGDIVIVTCDNEAVAKRLRKILVPGREQRLLESHGANGVEQYEMNGNGPVRILGVQIGLYREVF